MLHSRFFFAALFTLLPLPLLADSWDSLASISAEPTARYVCYGNADGKNITCDSTAPYVDATGKVGIGTASPAQALDVFANNSSSVVRVVNASSTSAQYPGFKVENYSGSGAALWGSPSMYLFAAAGSQSSPIALSSGYTLGGLLFYGQRSTTAQDWNRGASIVAVAEENFSASTAGTYLSFRTANIGAATDSEKMRITANGNVGVGTATPASDVKLDVNGATKVAGTGSETCATAADLGKIRLNPATGRIQICRQ